MEWTVSRKIALSGAFWFALVAVASLPLLLNLNPVFGHLSGQAAAGGGAFAAVAFGPGAAASGYWLARPIAKTDPFSAAYLGVLFVAMTNVLSALVIALISVSASGRGVVEVFSDLAVGVLGGLVLNLVADVMLFHGLPFIIGGAAALVFRSVAIRTWNIDEA